MENLFSNLIAASGGFNWYGFLIGAGMVACIIIAYFLGVKRGYYKDLVFDICIICLPFAIVGARLYYVIFDILGNGNVWTFKEVLGIGSGGLQGLAIYGGLIGACLGAVIVHFVKRKKPPEKRATFLQMCDLAFTVVLLGQIIGRWGNFANQEAYGNFISANKGDPWTWFPFAVFIPNGVAGTGYYQATFFYESFLNCIGLALLLWIYAGKRKSFDGFSLSMYCIFYGVVRVFVEGLRSDSLYWFGNVRVSQVLSALLIVFGVVFILIHVYRARNRGLKPFLFVPIDKLDNTYFGYESSMLSHPNIYEKKSGGFWQRMFGKSDAIEDSPEPDVDAPPSDSDFLPDENFAPDNELNGLDSNMVDSEQSQKNDPPLAEDVNERN